MPAAKSITAEDLARGQREISISEFFVKNKHLLGFDNPRKALLTTIKEAVDNSLDATQEARILPEIKVEVKPVSEDRFTVIVEDNGPGIVKEQIPRIFAKLLYGSKFHKLRQSRGQQGIGICMTSDTLVPLGDGKVLPIEEIVKKKLNNDIFVLTPDLKLGLGRIDKFWKIPAPYELVKIKTLGGNEIKLTSENPVLIRNEEGLSWKESIDVNEEDYIAISRKLGTHIKEEKIPLFNLLKEDVRVDNEPFVNALLLKLRNKYGTWKGVSERFSIKINQIKGWRKKSIKRRPEKIYLELFAEDLRIPKEELIDNCTRVGRLGNYINIPKYVSSEFMRFLGFISGDGHIQRDVKTGWGNNISFWNNDCRLQDDFKRLVKILFNITPRLIYHSKGRGKMHQFSSSLIEEILNECGVPSGKKYDKFDINEFLQRKDLLRPYLQALFDCEGSVSLERGTISFMIRNKKMTKYIQLFLLQFGIVSRINKLRTDLRITISDKKNIVRFRDEIGFTHPLKVKDLKAITRSIKKKSSKIEKAPFVKKQIIQLKKQLKIPYKEWPFPDLLVSNKKISVSFDTLQKAVDFCMTKVDLKKPPLELQELYCLLNSDVVWAKIISIDKIKSRGKYVYDLTMKDGNNFIANGILVHNSASCMYGQLTTGKPAKITSRTSSKKLAHYFELNIDTSVNQPKILKDEEIDWPEKKTGTKVEIELTAKYQKGNQSVDQYLKQTAIVNPHLSLIYVNPEGSKMEFPRATNELPKEPKEIKPHPHGIELGIMIKMLHDTKSKSLQHFLQNDFCRVSSKVAKEVCDKASLDCSARPERIATHEAEVLYKSLNSTKIMAPPTDCVTPIGEELIIKGLKKEVDAEFYTAVTRSPAVYRGNPFIIEAGIAYGGSLPTEDLVKVYRFANRVPLLYQLSACAATKSIATTAWKNYGLSQSKGALPSGPLVVLVHIASVWVPFTSESKEAIAHYPEIIKEMKLSLQEVGRKLGSYIRKNVRAKQQKERANLFEKYIPEVASALHNLSKEKKEVIETKLFKRLKKDLPAILGEENGKEEKG